MSLPRAQAALPVPTSPSVLLPDGACDAHVHLVGDDFPLWEKRVEDPAPGTLDDYLAHYRTHLKTLGFSRGVIVHSILFGADNSVTIQAVRRLGAGFKGIGLVGDDAKESDLDALVAANIKGVRLNYVHGGILSWEGAMRLAPALAERGLHIEMLAHAHLHLRDLAPDVRRSPVEIVFDHMAWPDEADPKAEAGLACLAELLAEGAAWTKLSAPYRFTRDAAGMTGQLLAANPDRCLWGSDWPHLMLNGVAQPDAGQLLNAFLALTTPEIRQKVFVDNPATLYGF